MYACLSSTHSFPSPGHQTHNQRHVDAMLSVLRRHTELVLAAFKQPVFILASFPIIPANPCSGCHASYHGHPCESCHAWHGTCTGCHASFPLQSMDSSDKLVQPPSWDTCASAPHTLTLSSRDIPPHIWIFDEFILQMHSQLPKFIT